MSDTNPRNAVDHLYETFIGIYNASGQRGFEAHARQMLERDIELLGLYFGSVDPLGESAEFALLAECIAYLRMRDAVVPVDRMIDSYIQTIFDEYKAKPPSAALVDDDTTGRDLVRDMKSIALADECVSLRKIDAAERAKLADGFIQLANIFLLRDGNVTDKEMEAIRDFETHIVKSQHSL